MNIIDDDVLARYTQRCIEDSLDAVDRGNVDLTGLRRGINSSNAIALTTLVAVMHSQGGHEHRLENHAAEWVGARIGQPLHADDRNVTDPLRQASTLTDALLMVLGVYPPGRLLPETAREEWADEAEGWRAAVFSAGHHDSSPGSRFSHSDVVTRHVVHYDAEDKIAHRWWVVNLFADGLQEHDAGLVRDALNHVRPGWDVESRYGRIEATSSNLV